jgi:ankyrin repeat protein
MNRVCFYACSNAIHDRKLNLDDKLFFIKECIDSSNMTGFDINYDRSKLLFDAIDNYHYPIIKLLVDNGIDVTSRNNKAIVKVCMWSDTMDMLKLLISHGADPTARDNDVICSVNCSESNNNGIDLVKFLIDMGGDPFAQNNKLFNRACGIVNIELVKFLISIGMDCTIPNNSPILTTFYRSGDIELKKLLLDNGADPNAYDEDECLLDMAIGKFDLEGCKLLLDYGANIDLYDFSNVNISCSLGTDIKKRQQVIDLFMDYGKDVSYIMNK